MEKRYPGQTAFYKGKVRRVHTVGSVAVAKTTNDISAFDVVLPFTIENKGAVLNLISAHFMKETEDIIQNCLLEVPTPEESIWLKTDPIKIEFVVREYNVGSFYRQYYEQKKPLPWDYDFNPALKEYERLPEVIVTPTTKAAEGHDEDISVEDIIASGLITIKAWKYLRDISRKLFFRGREMAADRGLIMLDTKFEFGKGPDGTIYLIDELFTPDSTRYLYADGYEEALKEGKTPKALSKEFVRQFLADNGFQGKAGQTIPEFSPEKLKEISARYEELFEKVVGKPLNDVVTAVINSNNGEGDPVINQLVKLRPQIEGVVVSIVMGSDSDLPVMKNAAKVLTDAGVAFGLDIVSAHRTPERLRDFARAAVDRGIKVIIAGAGGAAHLPCMVAANTILPVIGVPVKSSNSMIGLDSLLSIGQMPTGVPVATMAVDGAANAGLLALQILALSNPRIKEYLKEYKIELMNSVDKKQEKVSEIYYSSLVVQD